MSPSWTPVAIVNAAIVRLAEQTYGRLDVAILNAGVRASGEIDTIDLEVWERSLDVNLRAVVFGMRHAVPALRRAGGGAIVVTASNTGLAGEPKPSSFWPRPLPRSSPASLSPSTTVTANTGQTGKLGAASVAGSGLDVTREKIGWIREGAGDRFDQIELEIGAYFVAVGDDVASQRETMAGRFGVTADELSTHPHGLFGSVDQICDTLTARREQLGVSYVTVAQRNIDDFAPVVAALAGT